MHRSFAPLRISAGGSDAASTPQLRFAQNDNLNINAKHKSQVTRARQPYA